LKLLSFRWKDRDRIGFTPDEKIVFDLGEIASALGRSAYPDMIALIEAGEEGQAFLRDARAFADKEPGKLIIGQTPNILLFLGERHGLSPKAEAGRLFVHQLQLTLADFLLEIHDTHHPIGSGLYYEEQKTEAARRAEDFRTARAPKYFRYFERLIEIGGGPYLTGRRATYADLSLFQTVEGLRYAFPRLMKRLDRKHKRIAVLHDKVAARPRIAAYLKSKRRIAFNEMGIFRHYDELDA